MQTLFHRARDWRPVFLAFAALLALFTFAPSFDTSIASAKPDKTRTAHVIVQFADHDVAVREITFEQKNITGLQALQQTGFKLEIANTAFGPAVCAINGVGMPANDCFGDPQGRFWAYNYWDGNAWQFYPVGAGDSQVNNGGIEGWRWGQFGDPAYPATPALAANKALKWLQKQQSNTDGGYGSASASVETALAIGANTLLEGKWKRATTSPSLLDSLKQNGKAYAKTGAGASGKFALAQSAARACFPKKTKLPSNYYDANTGAYAAGTGEHAFAMLGTAALNETIPAGAVIFLKSLQQGNGGWEWSPGWGTDTNSTALALQALIAAGEPTSSTAIANGLAYLAAAQNTDGGFPYDPDSTFSTASDANSTAWVIQALNATGEDPFAAEWTKNANPITFLLSLQKSNGSFEWQSGTGGNLLATQQALPALLNNQYPIRQRNYKECK